jgi:hypothetical protein
MTWEAFRLTSKTPSELLTTLGPHGVDHLIRQALDTLWREYPEETRTLENVRRRAQEVYARNLKVWTKIKKPAPAAFFEDLLPYPADGFIRQSLVLCWMMLPRTGGRKFTDVQKIVQAIWLRNLLAWAADNDIFTATKPRKASKKTKAKPKAAKKSKGKKSGGRKR